MIFEDIPAPNLELNEIIKWVLVAENHRKILRTKHDASCDFSANESISCDPIGLNQLRKKPANPEGPRESTVSTVWKNLEEVRR